MKKEFDPYNPTKLSDLKISLLDCMISLHKVQPNKESKKAIQKLNLEKYRIKIREERKEKLDKINGKIN